MSERASRPQRQPDSLRLRFMLAIMLWVALGIAAIWFSATRLFTTHVEASFHDELDVHVRELVRLTRIGEDGQPVLIRRLSDPRYEVPLSGYYWQVTADGKVPLRSESMTRGKLDENVAHSPRIVHRLEQGPTGPAITYGMLEPGPGGEQVHFVIATDKSELDKVVASFTRELTIWLVSLAALLLATGIIVINFGMRPLNRLGEAVARLRAGKAEQLEGAYPREIAPLASDLNDYIRQTGEMIARARVQAGNLAHSLRTPLAVLTDEAERLAEGNKAPESAQVLLDQAQQMEQQIEYHLARARSSAGARLPGTSSTLPDLLVPILSAMRRLHPDKDFRIENRLPDGTSLPVDPVDLSELLSILLDNAGKWARREVVAEIGETRGAVHFIISDDGPGMAEDQIARAFDIGTRFDPDTPGSGLGLAIAKDIAESLGATLNLASPGRGLTARVTFEQPAGGDQA